MDGWMDVCLLEVEDFVDQLLSKEAAESPSDVKTADNLILTLPKWYDEEKFNHSWESVYKVRRRHILMSKAAMLKGQGIICQRDLALTLFGFIGFTFLKPEKFGVETLEKDDWEAYNQFWRVIGYMIGIEER
ncbi:hypothetical protein RR48_10029 [Papilio machaon]|uniref:Uncharacterized protein n=1 Tax=Papilio machaon TaxID=76193 RepID=A0A194RDR7_PAPMA|nr:hypothetical protein RR48_10029 [Papilio machaon]